MLLIGVDVGTTLAKAGAFNSSGQLVRGAVRRYKFKDGTTEDDPLHWWDAVALVLSEVASACGEKIAGISVGGQGPTMVVLDENAKPICPAILWMDLRAAEEAKRLSEMLDRRISPAFFAPKGIWLKEKRPDLYRMTRWLIQPMDYIVYRLTGEISTGLATRDIALFREDEILAGELNPSLFPEIRLMGEVVGAVRREAYLATGIPTGAPVFSGAPDFVEAILGTGTFEKGIVCDRGGTSEGIELCWDREIRDDRLYSAPHPVAPEMWHLSGTIPTTGKSLEWIGSIIGEPDSEKLTKIAEDSPPGSRGVVFLPYLAGDRGTDFGSRGMGGFFGLSLEHKREDIVRSVLEGCALSIHQVLSVMRKMGARPSEIRVTGSQAMSRLWNQIKADVTGLKVLVPEVIEGEVLGAAIISAYGAGLYPDLKSASGAMIKFKDVVLPRDETGPVYEMLSRLQSTLYGALEKAYVEAEPAL